MKPARFKMSRAESNLLLDIEKQLAAACEHSKVCPVDGKIVDCSVDYQKFGWSRGLLSRLWARNWIEVRNNTLRVCRDIFAQLNLKGAA